MGDSVKQIYSFTVLRYVHDVVAGEFLNVGIVMYVPALGELRVRTHKSASRLSSAFSGIEAPAFRKAMKAIDRGIARLGDETSLLLPRDTRPDARRHALRVLPEDDSSLQWSPSGGGLSKDLDATIDRLYKRFVTQHDSESTERLTDETLWGRATTKLAERNLKIPFQQKVLCGRIDSIQFENAWKNGSWHAYQTLSLDLASADAVKREGASMAGASFSCLRRMQRRPAPAFSTWHTKARITRPGLRRCKADRSGVTVCQPGHGRDADRRIRRLDRARVSCVTLRATPFVAARPADRRSIPRVDPRLMPLPRYGRKYTLDRLPGIAWNGNLCCSRRTSEQLLDDEAA